MLYEKIKIQIKEKYKFCNLYVKNLPEDCSEEKLRKLFDIYGKIRSCKTVKKEVFQQYIGAKKLEKVFGFICFFENEHAREAKLNLNNKPVFSSEIKLFVDYHQPKEERNEYLKLKMLCKEEKSNQQQQKFSNYEENARLIRQMNMGFDNIVLKDNKQVANYNFTCFNPQFAKRIPIQSINNNSMEKYRKEIFGEKLFNKLSINQNFFKYREFFSKIVGIFLDLDEEILKKLLNYDEEKKN